MGETDKFRLLVVARAGGSCEYCRLVEAATGMTFHIEHIMPRSQGGRTTLTNLALSCPGCNLCKGNSTSKKSKRLDEHPLFNPRNFDPPLLGWHLNFQLDPQTGLIIPRTAVGEVTVEHLQMNSSTRLFARKLQINAGLIS